MRAFHSNWTKPFLCKHIGEYYIEDFELLTTILSALKWQQYNGDIQMVTDEIGAAYYRKLGIENIWNLGIDDTLEEKMTEDINPLTFWAAGKIYALEKQTTEEKPNLYFLRFDAKYLADIFVLPFLRK